MGNRTELAADMLRRIGEDITQYAGVLKWMAPFGDCEAREMGDAFMKRIASWKALVSDLPPGNDRHPILDSDAEFKQDGYKTVDLGLSVKWADRNVGAATPEAFGDYFMWGSVTPDTDNVCDWAHAPFNDGATCFNETYFDSVKDTVCPGGVLAPDYDAAHAIMGGNWRMPTQDEVQELIDGTTHTLEELNGVKGMRFTSKTNGNSVFMPLGGSRYGSKACDVCSRGYAWSSSLSVGFADGSHRLRFISNGSADVYGNIRYYGFVVRGVC